MNDQLDRLAIDVWQELLPKFQSRTSVDGVKDKLLEYMHTDEGFREVSRARSPYDAIVAKLSEITRVHLLPKGRR